MVYDKAAGFDAALDLEAASYRLVVIDGDSAGFDVRFDFHLSFSIWMLNIERPCFEAAAHQYTREQKGKSFTRRKIFACAGELSHCRENIVIRAGWLYIPRSSDT